MWYKDKRVEQLMQGIGIEFEYRTGIPISRLKLKESLRNNARFGDALDETHVGRYAYAMKHGSAFPAIVIMNGLILAGNQRTHGAVSAGLEQVDAYVVTSATQRQIDEFIRRDNADHGKGLTDEERLQTCVEIHRKHKTPIIQLNNVFFGGDQTSYQRILTANRAMEVEEILRKKNVVAKQLPISSLAALHPISGDINILRDAAMLSMDFNYNTQQVADLAKEIKDRPSEADRAAVIKQIRSVEQHRAKRGTMPPSSVLRKNVLTLKKCLTAGYDGRAFPPIDSFMEGDAAKDMKGQVDDLINLLRGLKAKAQAAPMAKAPRRARRG